MFVLHPISRLLLFEKKKKIATIEQFAAADVHKQQRRPYGIVQFGKQSYDKSVIGIAQMRATNDKAANMQPVEQLVAQAKSKAATMLFLPEQCDYGGENNNGTLELSEPLDGPTMQRFQQLVRNNSIWLSLRRLHESTTGTADGAPKVYNAHILLNAS